MIEPVDRDARLHLESASRQQPTKWNIAAMHLFSVALAGREAEARTLAATLRRSAPRSEGFASFWETMRTRFGV